MLFKINMFSVGSGLSITDLSICPQLGHVTPWSPNGLLHVGFTNKLLYLLSFDMLCYMTAFSLSHCNGLTMFTFETCFSTVKLNSRAPSSIASPSPRLPPNTLRAASGQAKRPNQACPSTCPSTVQAAPKHPEICPSALFTSKKQQ